MQPSATAAPHGRRRHVFYKTVSAILYLLDFASNVYVVIQTYDSQFNSKVSPEVKQSPSGTGDSIVDHESWERPPIFQIMVSLMVFGHVSCFIFFLLDGLREDKQPVRQEKQPAREEKQPVQLRKLGKALGWALGCCFLPVAQFQRALQGLKCRPLIVNGDSRPTEKEEAKEARVEALYAIASASTDGGPLFLLQYLALTLGSSMSTAGPTFTKAQKFHPSYVLLLSLSLSALSATWNVTRAIVFLLPSRSGFLTLAAGAFTLSALTVRCTSLVSVVELQLVVSASKFFITLGTYVLLSSAVPFIGYCFLSRDGTSEVNCSALAKSTLRAAGFTWVSVPFGPLYPFASVAETCTTMGFSTTRFQARLCLYATCRWILEVSLMSTLLINKWSFCNRNHFHDHSASLYQLGYFVNTMMPCHIYVLALAVGIPIAILSQVLFQMLVQTEAVDTSQNGDAKKETTLAATGACTYDIAVLIGSAGMGVAGLAGV